MLKRTLTSLLMIPPVIYLIGWSPKWLFMLAVATAVVLALREYFALCRAMGFKALSWVGYPTSLLLCYAQIVPARWHFPPVTVLIVASLLVAPVLALGLRTELGEYLATTAVTLFGVLYIGLSLSFLVPIRFAMHLVGGIQLRHGVVRFVEGPEVALLLFVVIWAGDICAYLIGRSMGRMPFFPRISPRKTWEGAIAGLMGSLLAAWAYERWYWKTGEPRTVMLLAAWIAVAGQIGDLVESAIKRSAKQKDSGTLLPGHGGFLDRIDSLLFAAPALWLAMAAVIGIYGYSP